MTVKHAIKQVIGYIKSEAGRGIPEGGGAWSVACIKTCSYLVNISVLD